MSLSPPPSKPNLHVLALEPYWNLSHATFLEGYRRHSRHRVTIWDLPPRKWKWRMRGAAIYFAERARGMPPGERPDVVLASDYLNLADWKAIAPPGFCSVPAIAYFHENQVTYPLGERAPADFHYGWINLSSALAADHVLFNSNYHREEFLEGVGRALGLMPDHVPPGLQARIRGRSQVFPVGIDFELHRQIKGEVPAGGGDVPVVAWNHRWEYDKDPELLAESLLELRRRGARFRVAICGQAFDAVPPAIDRIRSELADVLVHVGFVPERKRYLSILRGADVILSTARQEFFGVAVVEAMYLGCIPILPRRLSYPEIVPPNLHDRLLYRDAGELVDLLARTLREPPVDLRPEIEAIGARFDWRVLAPELDAIVEDVSRRRGSS